MKKRSFSPTYEALCEQIICCRRCPRLVYHRQYAPVRKSFKGQSYWRRPVPGFGDLNGWLLIVGLAPVAQGANRTGRVFTGDESARFLMRALYQVGFSNQPISESLDDGLKLKECYLTAIVKCVPPQNRPLKEEEINCSGYFENEFLLLKKIKAILALGKFAFDGYQHFLKREEVISSLHSFGHGKRVDFPNWPSLYGSYHPSPQNTYTGKLTENQFLQLLTTIKQECSP